jgi:primosomal protein N' (replication factor Y)
MSEYYRMPVGLCLWLFLPPGITGKRDVQVLLLQEDATKLDPVEAQLVALLKRRGPLTGQQLNIALPGQDWRGAVDTLAKAGIVQKENRLMPPRAKPKLIRTAALAINPGQIMSVARHLGRASKQADLLEVIAALPDDMPPVEQVLSIAEASRATLMQLVKSSLVLLHERDHRDDPQTLSLTIPHEAVDENLIALRKGEKFLHILRVLARENEPMDVSWLYAQTDAKLADLKRLEDEGLVILSEEEAWRDSLAERDFVPSVAPALTPEQAAAWQPVEAKLKAWDWGHMAGVNIDPSPMSDPLPAAPASDAGADSNVFLLHGVTGSGKTEIYLRAIELTLAQGRQAMFLVPEIALTAQTIRRVASRFAGRLAVVHGALSEGERYDTWRRARDGLIDIVVGPRSALFTPFPDIGLIILDEEHDHSYKQGPGFSQPYYHTRQVAEVLMRRNDGVLILGSATPDLESAFRARRGDLHLLEMPNRIMGHRSRILELSEREGVVARYYPASAEDALMIDLPPVEVVDMRAELKQGNTSMFSHALHRSLEHTLQREEQAMLFLNRRGMNTFVFCRDCGYIDECPRCDVPLTYHQYDENMRCHLCGYVAPPRRVCPACASRRIKYFGAGTQHIEQELKTQFPQARILRWDADTARSPRAHDDMLQQFMNRQADVLIGTQMVAKGLDLPLVTLVGVVNADVGLGLPDFRAGERNFQLLTQVSGRAGRGLLGGKAILQTYQPDHYVIQAAAQHDYNGFYEQEIAYRRELGYPPFRRLVRVVFQLPNEAKARTEAERAAALFQRRIEQLQLTDTEIIGPAPCFFAKINYTYRWHILLRGPEPTLALDGVDIPKGWYVDIDPVDVL